MEPIKNEEDMRNVWEWVNSKENSGDPFWVNVNGKWAGMEKVGGCFGGFWLILWKGELWRMDGCQNILWDWRGGEWRGRPP